MKTTTLEKLCKTNFECEHLSTLRQFWNDTNTFSCIGLPKKQNNLLYLCGCKARYTAKNGEVFFAESGDAVYAPQESEYSVTFYDVAPEGYTIGINFRLFDGAGEALRFSENILIYRANGGRLPLLFEEMETPSENFYALPLKNKIGLLKILLALYAEETLPENSLIQKGVAYLNSRYAENTDIGEIARLCNVSEVYFRRLFKAQTGLSPAAYRAKLRMEKAAQYLEYGAASVREISETLGFATVSHFIGQFKKNYGVSPLVYRKNAVRRPPESGK